MIVHLATSRQNLRANFKNLKAIVGVIHQTGNILARDWIDPQYHAADSPQQQDLSAETIYELTIEAIERADVVIVEGSERSFGSGFQLATALNRKKPVLLLLRQDGVGAESLLSKGLREPLLTRAVYGSQSDLEAAVLSFIGANTVKTKDLRFNFVIDRRIYNHLRFKSFQTGKTKAEIVRDLLLKDLSDK